MALTDIKDAIVAIVQGQLPHPPVGPGSPSSIVYPYQPLIRDDATLYGMFGKPLLGFTVSRESTASRDRTVGGIEDTHLVIVRCYQALTADNENDFEDLVEEVRSALRANRTLSETAFITNPPPSVRIHEPRNYCGVLVHYAEIAVYAQEYPV